ncbi:hypothetical protein LTR85_011703 [Meristemomyces frigidus]|nr:hypothetical protein LTR85_011703 [Meristemomyces frigidus]
MTLPRRVQEYLRRTGWRHRDHHTQRHQSKSGFRIWEDKTRPRRSIASSLAPTDIPKPPLSAQICSSDEVPQMPALSFVPQSPLLALPAELRNRIYEFALLEQETVHVDDNLRRPALLDTCRQIRSEALRLWYTENAFLFTIHDCDGTVADKFLCSLRMLPINDSKLHARYVYTGVANWKNLKAWAKLDWSDKRQLNLEPSSSNGGSPEADMIAAVSGFVGEMLDKSWEEVDTALERLRATVARYTKSWEDTED